MEVEFRFHFFVRDSEERLHKDAAFLDNGGAWVRVVPYLDCWRGSGVRRVWPKIVATEGIVRCMKNAGGETAVFWTSSRVLYNTTYFTRFVACILVAWRIVRAWVLWLESDECVASPRKVRCSGLTLHNRTGWS